MGWRQDAPLANDPAARPDVLRHFEAFLGGGAVLLAVLGRTPRAAIAGDLNRELVTAWQVVQRDPEALSAALRTYAEQDSEAFYCRLAMRPLASRERTGIDGICEQLTGC